VEVVCRKGPWAIFRSDGKRPWRDSGEKDGAQKGSRDFGRSCGQAKDCPSRNPYIRRTEGRKTVEEVGGSFLDVHVEKTGGSIRKAKKNRPQRECS